jgi:hypothetical protein
LGRPVAVSDSGDVAVSDRGDVAVTTDDRCTRTVYVDNTTTNLSSFPSRTTVTGVDCATAATLPADAVSDTRVFYDGSSTAGQAPTRDDVTRTAGTTTDRPRS